MPHSEFSCGPFLRREIRDFDFISCINTRI
jgi:hypothetical protein